MDGFRGVTSLPVRCDGSMSDGRPKGFPSTRLEMQPPYGLAVAISDHQDGSFEQQEVSGRDVVASAKIIAVQRKRWIRRRWAGQGLGNEDAITEAGVLAKTAEVARHLSTWHGAGRDWPPRTLRQEAPSPPPGRGFAFAARRRRQAAARPLVGPPQISPL